MDMHICGDQVKNISFLGEATSCKMHQKVPKQIVKKKCCHTKTKKSVVAADNQEMIKGFCCHNENFAVQTSTDFNKTESAEVNASHLLYTFITIINFFGNFSTEKVQNDYLYYSPPLVSRDISVLYQVFLI